MPLTQHQSEYSDQHCIYCFHENGDRSHELSLEEFQNKSFLLISQNHSKLKALILTSTISFAKKWNKDQRNFRWVILFVLSIFLGSFVNGLLIQLGHLIFPSPIPQDFDSENLAQVADLLQTKHYIFPLFAHFFGSFTSSFLTYKFSPKFKIPLSFLASTIFLGGGIYLAFLIPAPWWFLVLDLGFCYIPAAFLGIIFATYLTIK